MRSANYVGLLWQEAAPALLIQVGKAMGAYWQMPGHLFVSGVSVKLVMRMCV